MTEDIRENSPLAIEIKETMKQTGYVNDEGKFVPTEEPVYLQSGEDVAG